MAHIKRFGQVRILPVENSDDDDDIDVSRNLPTIGSSRSSGSSESGKPVHGGTGKKKAINPRTKIDEKGCSFQDQAQKYTINATLKEILSSNGLPTKGGKDEFLQTILTNVDAIKSLISILIKSPIVDGIHEYAYDPMIMKKTPKSKEDKAIREELETILANIDQAMKELGLKFRQEINLVVSAPAQRTTKDDKLLTLVKKSVGQDCRRSDQFVSLLNMLSQMSIDEMRDLTNHASNLITHKTENEESVVESSEDDNDDDESMVESSDEDSDTEVRQASISLKGKLSAIMKR